MSDNVGRITPLELKDRIDQGKSYFLLDVREEGERELCKLDDQLHIPMNAVAERVSELNPDEEIIVYCRSGQRSQNVCQYLAGQGFKDVKNLVGGILGWADQIDPTIPRY